MRKPPGLFFTGSDTGVGKTYVAALAAAQLAAQGLRVGVYKPAASGCPLVAGQRRCDDAERLWEAAGRPGELAQVCPQVFAAPLAPHLAAQAEGRQLDTALLASGLEYWRGRSDVLIVEGAGGLMSPLGDLYVADLACDFGLPLVVVARNALGAINQTLQTLIVAATFRRGLSIAGVVLNQPQPPDPLDQSPDSNRRELAARAVPPILGSLAYGARRFENPVDWLALARGGAD